MKELIAELQQGNREIEESYKKMDMNLIRLELSNLGVQFALLNLKDTMKDIEIRQLNRKIDKLVQI
jgi:hypothetical protein